MPKQHYTAPTQSKGDGEVWYRGRRVATVAYLLGLFRESYVAAGAGNAALRALRPLPVRGGSLRLNRGSIPADGEELLMVLADGHRLRFTATHKLARVYGVTPVGQ